MDPASHRWHVWTPLHSGLNATASNRWHVHLAQASTRTHLALGEPKPHRGPAHLGLARCGSTTADANAWSSIHKTSAPWTNSTTGTSSPHDQQAPDDPLFRTRSPAHLAKILLVHRPRSGSHRTVVLCSLATHCHVTPETLSPRKQQQPQNLRRFSITPKRSYRRPW